MNLIHNVKCFPRKKFFQTLSAIENENIILRKHSAFSPYRTNNKYCFSSPFTKVSITYSQNYYSTGLQFCKVPRTNVSTRTRQSTRSFFESSGADINTNVSRDVVIFEYNNDRLFAIIKVFGISQIFVWGYLANTAYTCLKDAPVEKPPHRELQWWEKVNLGENWVRNGITTLCVIMGFGLSLLAHALSLRTVKQIILHRGGRDITIHTYSSFVGNRFRVPLHMVSCSVSRKGSPHHLPLKIKGKWFYFTLDSRGTYPHPTLFEWTAGLKRSL
nr:PREDICTED: transmembrane protein 223 [Bemisia tabaci]